MTENEPSPWSAGGAARGDAPQGMPDQAQSAQSHAAQSQPAQSQPAQSQPAQSQPGQADAEQAQAAQAGASYPGMTYPDRTYPAMNYPGNYPGMTPAGPPQQTSPFAAPPGSADPRRRAASGKLVAGVAVLALLAGGGAGAVGGYLAAGPDSGGASVNALDQAPPERQAAASQPGTVEAVAGKLGPSVVQIQVVGGGSASEGSGFVISSDGYILTNNHVIELAANGGEMQVVFQDGKKAPASVVGRDPTTDIAVVKAEGVNNLPEVDLGRSDDLKVGQQVVAIGSPFELAGTVTSGIVSSLNRPVTAGGQGQETVMDAIQTDAAINPGNSGGPLANMSGQVIGINSVIYSPNSTSGGPGQSEGGNVGIGFAIPIDQARRTAEDIIESGHATQTYIGAEVGNAPDGGAVIGSVVANSPAQRGGLKEGDVIVKLDDRVIDSADTLVAAIRTRAPGEQVTATLANGDTLQLTLGGQPVQPR